MRKIVLIAHNIRSNHNIGSIIRTAECLGVSKITFSGYSPHPSKPGDKRLPHVKKRNDSQISKTSLGAENTIDWEHIEDIKKVVSQLLAQNFEIVALEQTKDSVKLEDFNPTDKVALIIGNEAEGIDDATLRLCQKFIEIPMLGKKESLNVVQATAITLYALQKA